MKIVIGFLGFWSDFDEEDNFITNILKKHFEVQIEHNLDGKDRNTNVEYLFYTNGTDDYLKYDCIRIYYTGENMFPNFNLCDYAIGFEHADIGDRYIRFPLYFVDNYRTDYLKAVNRVISTEEKQKFCAMVVSRVELSDDYRVSFFEKLSERYKKVDSGGKYANNIGKPSGVEDKEAFLKEYKFSIAMENASHPGYCTEKLCQSFAAGNIPIYWGDPDVGKYFNTKAFINCNDYANINEVIEKVREIDSNQNLYHKMLEEPVISNENETIEIYDQKLEKWLCGIVNQPYQSAYRRNRVGNGIRYEMKLIKMINTTNDIQKKKDAIKKILFFWKRK